MKNSTKAIIAGVVTVLVVIIAIIVAGVQTVDYYNLGLLRRRSTGTINKDYVYRGKRLLYGPDYDVVTFPATAIFVQLRDLVGISKNNQQIKFKIHFQYFIRKNELGKLFENHKYNYHSVIVKTAADSIKDATSRYDVDEFINNREEIRAAFFHALRKNIEGICCLEGCDSMRNGCLSGCKNESCTDEDRGLFVEVKYFQFLDVDLNSLLKAKKLKGLILREEELTKHFEQTAKLVRQETRRRVRQQQAKTNEVKEHAVATAELIRERADARYTSTIEEARGTGLKKLSDTLNIKDEISKNSFDFLKTIQKSKHISLAVGFQQYVTGNFR